MRRISVPLVLVMLLVSIIGVPFVEARQGAGARSLPAGRYIVTFVDEPLASYDG